MRFFKFSAGLREILDELIESVRITVGYVFIFSWWCWLKFKLSVLPYFPPFFAVVSLLDFFMLLAEGFEAADPKIHRVAHGRIVSILDRGIHAIGFRLALGPKPLLWFSIISLLLATFMVIHHHRVAHRVREHLSLLNALRHLAQEATRLVVSHADTAAAETFIQFALQVLAESTTEFKAGRTKKRLLLRFVPSKWFPKNLERTATVLRRSSALEEFDLVCQWPRNVFSAELMLPDASAAGKALEEKGIVYIPCTNFRHGVRVWVDETKSPHFRRLGFAKNAFVDVGAAGAPKPRSLICIETPAEGDTDERYVICLSSNTWWCFDEVDYQATDLVSSIIGIVFTELHRDLARAAL